MRIPLLLIIILASLTSCSNKDKNNKTRPKKTDITESVYASVKVIPEISYHPQPVRSGVIDSIYVKEGDLVFKGQPLFQIIPSVDIKGQLTDAEINLEEAKSNYFGPNSLLNNIKLEIQTSKEKFILDSLNYERLERLYAKNIGTQQDLDQAKLKYENTRNQLDILEQKLIQTKTTLQNNYKKAQNRIETENEQLADFTILSKIDGKVFMIKKEEGDLISAQEKFAEIGSSDRFKIEMDIDEVDITRIELGDSVLITLNAYPEKVFMATISKISPKKDDLTQTFTVESIFSESPPKLYYGLAGEANIIISRRKNTIVIPADYLLPTDRILTEDGEIEIVVGMKNLEFVEILSGADTSTVILKPNE